MPYGSKSAAPIRCLAAAFALVLSACAPIQRDGLRLAAEVRRPERSVVLLFADGLNHATVRDMLNAGELPHIRRIFVEGGVTVEHAITCLPSVTYPVTVSLLTGMFPGHHGVVGNQWFDRRALRFQNYSYISTFQSADGDYRPTTIFEFLADRLTVNLQLHTRRGVTQTFEDMIPNAVDYFIGRYYRLDKRTVDQLERVIRFANNVGRWPDLIAAYFPAADQTGHAFGPD
ncbi:MAG: alkaline phosphatase family protein, partial [Phycisphaerae bacterium]